MKEENDELIRLKNAQMIINYLPLSDMNEADYNSLVDYVQYNDNDISPRIKELIIQAHKLNNKQSQNEIQ